MRGWAGLPALAALVLLALAAPAAGQFLPAPGGTAGGSSADPQTPPPPSPNDVRELMRLLADDSVRDWLRRQAGEAEKDAEGGARGAGGALSPREVMERTTEGFARRGAELAGALSALPELPGLLTEVWRQGISPAQKVRAVTLLLIFVVVGAGLEWLYRQAVRLPLLRLEQAPQAGPRARFFAALRRAALTVAGLVIFAVGSIGAFVSFDWPPVARAVILDTLVILLIFRLIQTMSLFLLAPFAPPLRLVPLATGLARAVHRTVVLGSAVALLAVLGYLYLDRIAVVRGAGRDLEPALTAAALMLALFLLGTFWTTILHVGRLLPRHIRGVSAEDLARWRRSRIYLAVLGLLIFAAWVVSAHGLLWALAIFGPLPPVLLALRAWIDHFFDQASEAIRGRHEADFAAELAQFRGRIAQIADPAERDAQVEPSLPALPEPYAVARPIVQRAARFVALIGAIALFATAWGVNVADLSAPQTPLTRALRVLFDSVVVLLLADLVWTWARVVIDRRLADYVPPEGSEAPGPEARMITLLPLFRTSILVILLTMVGLSILTSLGINIAPLLAGAGILGIAIGFGTQSLVRDIVSGLFFLIDDAFRVGEYIEVGELMGTVESISVRSMRIRHHRGKVHTVPYGELKSVTNHSRDWVIMKLEFRVPFDTDLQLVKKLVKKVGAELKENDFYGASILSTLKSQGVRRMEEFNMVVGVKFMTKPGEQWLVRRDAYQKVRDAFDANGIRLAERNVKVEIDRDPASLSPEERSAIAAAAQDAAQPAAAPPRPLPDEP